MKLLAYKIGDKVVNRDIFNWNTSQLNGNKPWIASDVDVVGYEEITSIQNWDNLSIVLEKDYLFIRQRIKDILEISSVNKEGNVVKYSDTMGYQEGIISSKYFLIPKEKRDIYLSENEQQSYWDILVSSSQMSRKKRWEKAKTFISYKLSSLDSSDLALATHELCNNYINYNIITKSKDGTSGLFDFLRGIEDFSSNGYPSKSYWTQSDQDRMLDILENGNY